MVAAWKPPEQLQDLSILQGFHPTCDRAGTREEIWLLKNCFHWQVSAQTFNFAGEGSANRYQIATEVLQDEDLDPPRHTYADTCTFVLDSNFLCLF